MKSTFVERLANDCTDADFLRYAIKFGVNHYGFNAKDLYKLIDSRQRLRFAFSRNRLED